MKKFAMLGKWHVHAPQYAEQLMKTPGCTVAKVWDPGQKIAEAWAAELGCTAASIEEILSDPEIEGVVIGSATNEHPELLMKSIESGKAVFTEKVLTLKTEDALKVEAAVEAHHTRFAISFPHYAESPTQAALKIAKEGKIGTLNYARVRKAHNGATGNWLPAHFYDPIACGGGAMIDLGAHPMYLLADLLGMPVKVQSSFTKVTGKAVEDNAVSLLTFENGAIGVSETGFVSVHYPLTIELGGTEGALLMRDNVVTWCGPETDGKWVEVSEYPAPRPTSLVTWALANTPEEIPAEYDIKAAVRLTKIMEAAYK